MIWDEHFCNKNQLTDKRLVDLHMQRMEWVAILQFSLSFVWVSHSKSVELAHASLEWKKSGWEISHIHFDDKIRKF